VQAAKSISCSIHCMCGMGNRPNYCPHFLFLFQDLNGLKPLSAHDYVECAVKFTAVVPVFTDGAF